MAHNGMQRGSYAMQGKTFWVTGRSLPATPGRQYATQEGTYKHLNKVQHRKEGIMQHYSLSPCVPVMIYTYIYPALGKAAPPTQGVRGQVMCHSGNANQGISALPTPSGRLQKNKHDSSLFL